MKTISRRRLLGAGAAGAAVFGFPAILRAQPRQLVVGGPGGQEAQTRKLLIPGFEKQHNCKVLYDGGQTLPNLKKMQASPQKPPFDVYMADEPGTILGARDKLFEPLKPAQVKNLSKLVPGSIMKDGVWIVYYNPAIAIGYNTRSLKTFDSWARMWDPAMKERMMIPHPKTTQFAHMITMASHLETGKPFKEAQYDVDAGFRRLRALRPNLLQSYLASAQASVLLEKGEAWAAAGFFTTYVQGRKAAGAPIDMARPKEGSFAYPKVIAKVRNAASPELADAWIDACISPEWQMVWQKEFFGAPTLAGVPVEAGLIATKDLIPVDMEWHTDKINEMSDRFDREIKI